MRKLLLIAFFGLMISCAEQGNKESVNWEGSWTAKWKTDPASFGTIEGITDYSMNGKFIFNDNELNIKAYGFEGCVFSVDTLDHRLQWSVSGDSLILVNDEQTPGMVYMIKETNDNTIKLQLLEDIFLTLTRS